MTAPLTPRQRDLLIGMAQGQTNQEIGKALYVTEDTVRTHAVRLFQALGARNRAHAVAIGYERGILPVNGGPTAAVRAVLDLHAEDAGDLYTCRECTRLSGSTAWPCPTVRAVEANRGGAS